MSQHFSTKPLLRSYTITDGPSKDALKIAFFERRPLPSRVVFTFAGAPYPIYEVVIMGVGVDDNATGECWKILGRAYGFTADRLVPAAPFDVRIDYRTDIRKGTVRNAD